ncbi:hypothetical protein CYMTET_22438, partial [Cymbomonas tetramitiformis]
MEEEDDFITCSTVEGWLEEFLEPAYNAVCGKRLLKCVSTGEIRDASPFSDNFHSLVFQLMRVTWSRSVTNSGNADVAVNDEIDTGYRIFVGITRLSEFQVAKVQVSDVFVEEAFRRIGSTQRSEEQVQLRSILHWLYNSLPSTRVKIRSEMGSMLTTFASQPRECAGVATVLEVLGCIIRGFSLPLSLAATSLLSEVLVPLHQPGGMLSMRYAEPIIAQYHPPLVNCMLAMVEKEPSLGIMMVRGITKAWPTAWQANSLKEMLLLDEAEQLFGKMASLGTAADAAAAVMAFVPSLLSTAESENGRVAERALRLLAGKVVLGILSPDSLSKQRRKLMGQIMPAILKLHSQQDDNHVGGALLLWANQGGAKHWSDSVNVKRGALLRALHELDPDAFAAEADALWGPGGISETQGLQSQASRRAADELEEQRRNQSGGGMRRPAGGLGSPSTLSRTTTAPPPLPRGVVPHMAPPPVRLPASSKRASWLMQATWTQEAGGMMWGQPGARRWTLCSAPRAGMKTIGLFGGTVWSDRQARAALLWTALPEEGVHAPAAGLPLSYSKVMALGVGGRAGGQWREEAGSEVTGDDQESCLPMEVDPERPAWSGGNEGSGDHTEAQASGCERVLEFAGSLSPPEEEQVAEANPDDALQSLTPTLLPDLGFQGRLQAALAGASNLGPQLQAAKGRANSRNEDEWGGGPAGEPVKQSTGSKGSSLRGRGAREGPRLVLALCTAAGPDVTIVGAGDDDWGGGFRHAWHIHRGKAKATWPAYAVKCISTTTIRFDLCASLSSPASRRALLLMRQEEGAWCDRDMGYEASVRREVAVLRVLSHPGVARLVASFRWRDGAYLVPALHYPPPPSPYL